MEKYTKNVAERELIHFERILQASDIKKSSKIKAKNQNCVGSAKCFVRQFIYENLFVKFKLRKKSDKSWIKVETVGKKET